MVYDNNQYSPGAWCGTNNGCGGIRNQRTWRCECGCHLTRAIQQCYIHPSILYGYWTREKSRKEKGERERERRVWDGGRRGERVRGGMEEGNKSGDVGRARGWWGVENVNILILHFNMYKYIEPYVRIYHRNSSSTFFENSSEGHESQAAKEHREGS